MSSLCDYSDRYILVKGRITVTGARADAVDRQADERDKGVVFKNYAPFINCKTEINNTEINNAKDIDIVMPMFNLTEYSDNYSKTSGNLYHYYRNETGKSPNNGNAKCFKIIVPLKYLSNFWRTLEMPLINYEVNLILTWSTTCFITNSTVVGRFAISDTKLYVPVVT